MNAIEFLTKIGHRKITLPDSYKSLEYKLVRIIILSENEIKLNAKGMLRKAFYNLRKISSFSTIDNVVTWQKEIRNDW